jgi:pimeloyl-ACP methyl ester carboxylesterase
MKCELIKVKFKGIQINVGLYKNQNQNKKDVLFLHGMGSNTQDSYSKTFDELPQDRLCAIDWLGHGETTKLFRNKDEYGAVYMSDYLKTVIDFLITNNILDKRFSIVALSMSAIPVAYLYSQYKGNFKKIVFINPAGIDKKMGYIFAFFSKCITKNIFFSWFFSYWILDKKARKVL